MLYLGADHRGFQLKEKVKDYLDAQKIPYEDLGAFSLVPSDDFTQYAHNVAKAVAKNSSEHKGIAFCGSGVGVDVVANKEKEIMAGLLFSEAQAKSAAYDDAINIAAIPADYVSGDEAKRIVAIFLETEPSKEERHMRRVGHIRQIEQANFR